MSAVDCMPIGLTYDASLTGCKSATRALASLAALNLWSAFLAGFFGHDKIRQKIPSCSCSKSWKPYSSLVLTLLHPVTMGISTITMRVNGFKPNPLLMYGFWTMRPRMIGALLWYTICSCFRTGSKNPYLWTFKDNIIEESVLNIFSLPFALIFIIWRDDSGSGSCAANPHYQIFFDSFFVVVAVGAIAGLLLLFMTLHSCSKIVRSYTNLGDNLSSFWKWAIAIGALNMLIAFASQWILWGTFYYNAGTDFCPGSLIGESIAWAVALLIIAIGRPLIGGPAS